MTKAKKKVGRPKRERTSQARGDLRHYNYETYWRPNKYASAVLKNLGIAVLFLGAVYAITIYLGAPATTETAMNEKPRATRSPGHTTEHASVIEDQSKKASNNPTATTMAGATAFVSGNNVLVREKPTLNAKVLGKAIFGTSIDITASEGKWVQINSPAQNLSGWTEKASLNF